MPRVSRVVTLTDVAKRAGVHVSTASRALSSDPRIGAETVDRIRLLADEMGYEPDPAAAALRTGRSGVLGVLVPRVSDYVLATIYEGIDSRATERGYNTFVSNTNDDPLRRREKLNDLLLRRVEGVVLGDARLDGDELVGILSKRGVPYVLVNRRLRGHPSVTTDDVLGGRLAASHLLELGHENVGIIAGPSYVSTCAERTHGFVSQFRSAGMGLDEGRIINSGTDAVGGYEAGSALLAGNPDLTAIFAINDFAAIGAMGAVREFGKVPGRDVAVVGYNDVPLSSYLPVPLTSVSSPMFQMGQEAMTLLFDLMAGGEAESLLLTPHLVARASTVP
ncbi:LacI family transcriptional regulator [Arthrobacter sp. B3I9]|uniref:LacI family DNA-binding transcriptional regulator n=1 Tax=Arthrobacter sp. B3I9 TaxID=3042270 RepID=UPI002793B878|nr:LacI family DNA-binding transcriptional regulator [Arthrobacter sp. B3I9]MDQ0848144.1 LacI family transcriptional regulator [Arthrobacter sp. B3I9]